MLQSYIFFQVKSLHPVGSAIRGRVLNVDSRKGRVNLTCQPALIDSSLPILDSLRDVAINRVYAGTICHIFPNTDSALVQFYRGVTGILFLKQVHNYTYCSFRCVLASISVRPSACHTFDETWLFGIFLH